MELVPRAQLGSAIPAVRPARAAASGPCRCSRRSCWHSRQCKTSGVVRISRVKASSGESNSSVVLCRECAAPTQRNRVA
jgi:hypothetical protein